MRTGTKNMVSLWRMLKLPSKSFVGKVKPPLFSKRLFLNGVACSNGWRFSLARREWRVRFSSGPLEKDLEYKIIWWTCPNWFRGRIVIPVYVGSSPIVHPNSGSGGIGYLACIGGRSWCRFESGLPDKYLIISILSIVLHFFNRRENDAKSVITFWLSTK